MALSQFLSLLGLGMPWLLFLAGLLAYFFYNSIRAGNHPTPPGPTGVYVFFDFLKAVKGGKLYLVAEKLARKYGEVVLCKTIIGNLCFLNSARLVREVFAGKGTELVTSDRPPLFTGLHVFKNFKDVSFSDTAKNPKWARMRKLLHSSLKFYGSGVEKLENTLQTELRRLTEELEADITVTAGKHRELSRGYCEVELEKFFSTSVQRVVAILITGEPQEGNSRVPQLVGDFSLHVQKLLRPTTDFLLYTFPFLRFIPGTYYKDLFDKTLKCRDTLVEEVFTKGKARHVPGKPKGILGTLLEEQTNCDNSWLTDDDIQGLFLNILSAAYVTSTELLKSCFLHLVHNAHVMKRIQQEVDSIFGQRTPSFEGRRKLPFTEATVLEVLRTTSTLPLGVSHETREDVFIDEIRIPKKTVLFENLWWMNRDPKEWEDPDIFRPERFLDDEGQLVPPTHPMRSKLLAFGIGKRSCPGENFARSRAFLYVTTLLQKFDFLPPVNHDLLPLRQDSWTEGLALELKPCHVAIKRRSQL